MFGMGMSELLLILLVALVVVGPRKLPDLAKNLGKGLTEFRKATDDIKSKINEHEVYQDVQNIRKDFKQTVDAMNPRTILETDGAKLEPSEPKPDLAPREAVYQAIDDELAAGQTPPPPPAAGGPAASTPSDPGKTTNA